MKKILLACLILLSGKMASAQCTAGFVYNNPGVIPANVNFFDSSSSLNPIVSYQWDFGDGGNATGQNPSHTYVIAGVYLVCLTISDGVGCSDTICMSVNLSPQPTAIASYFNVDSMSQYNCTSPAQVGFYYYGNANGYQPSDSVNVSISYGDGVDTSFYMSTANTTFQGYLSHAYMNGGNYTAQLIITGSDNNADTSVTQTIIVASWCGTVTGTIYEDNNNNCVFDGGDLPLQNISVEISSGGIFMGWAVSDASGLYSFNVPAGNYDITVHPTNGWVGHYTATCPPTGIISITTVPSSGNDFGLTCPPGFDLQGYVNGWGFRPGFTTSVCVSAYNQLCNTPSGQIQLVFNSIVTPLPDSSGIGYTVSGNTVTLPINNPDLYWSFCIPVAVSTTAQIGDSVCVDMTITPTVGDANPANNTGTFCFPVRNSYDPNDKSVSPAGVGSQGYILPDTKLTYTIRFQNTGTADAINIFILDSLDANLDPTSVELIGTSHDVTWTILTGNILRFNFDNINLADSNTSEAASHGYVTYRINMNTNVAQLGTINNTAGIYFDFNPPIITNTTLNTVDRFLSVSSIQKNSSLVNVYPNPSNDKCFLSFKDAQKRTLTVNDVLGKEVYKNSILSDSYILNTSKFAEGVYTVRLSDDTNKVDSFKLIITH